MILTLLLVALATPVAAGLVAALLWRSDRAALVVGAAGAALGCALGAGAAAVALWRGVVAEARLPWGAPMGELHVGLDPLAAFFLLCVFTVSGLAAVYGGGYLAAYLGKRRVAGAVVAFDVLVAAMAGVVLARDGVLFLVAWEAMSVASFFLVTFEDDRPDVRRAGMTYLIASHVGVVFLFVVFGLLARHAGGWGFDAFAAAGAPADAGLCFLLAFLGFGTKAGFWPVHLWLPEAHPAAPSHVSALMSGVMIKMGIYGLLRVLTVLGPPPAWWGAVALAVGAVSALAGIVHALAQHDLKRALAYSSVENVGIVALGIGLGLLGKSHGDDTLAFLGFGGALLHVLSHGIMKGLLFQAAGSVLHATGTRRLDALGGLSRRMPWTAGAFLVGAAAISGLPPLAGFAGEWLIYVGAFRGGAELPTAWAVCAAAVVPALALCGGLAAACFVRAFGVVFLGEPRSDAGAHAHEAPPSMRWPMLAGAALCVAIGVYPSAVLRLIEPAAAALAGVPAAPGRAIGPLVAVTRIAALLAGLVAALALLRLVLLRGRDVRAGSTWGCGYAAPTARMQYTAESFAEPLLTPLAAAVARDVERDGPAGYFPAAATYEERLGDVAGERVLVPAARRFVSALGRLRVIQHGRVQLYLAYVLVTLIALLVWQLGFGGN